MISQESNSGALPIKMSKMTNHLSFLGLIKWRWKGIPAPDSAPFRTIFFFLFFFCFLRLHPWHMDVPRLGVESELQLPSIATATATLDLSHIFNQQHSSWRHWILNPPSESRDGTRILTVTSQIHFCCTSMHTLPG